MGWFKNLQTKSKLLVGFGLMCALLIGVAGVAYRALAAVEKIEREEVTVSWQATLAAREVRAVQNRNRALLLEVLLDEDPTERAALRHKIEEGSKEVDVGVDELKTFVRNQGLAKEAALLANVEKDLGALREGRAEAYRLLDAGKRDDAIKHTAGAQNERFERIRQALTAIGIGIGAHADAAEAESARLAAEASRVFAGFAITALLVALLMVWLLNRLIAAPLQAVTVVAERVAAGDLTARVEAGDRSDEVGALQRALQTMLDNLRESNRELREGFGILASSSTEILATVTQVSASAVETAASVSQTSTTVEEVKQTAQLASQKARAVEETAVRTAAVSESGRKAVAETLDGMNRIREQMESIADTVVRLSEQGQTIGEIIATVSDLAEQSNLLAVNAALEATRAGEHGKGFAVVAQEVKSLAEQSRLATKQVRTILMDVQKATSAAVMATEQGTKAVAAGAKQAADAGESIRALGGSVGEAAQAATQIAASSQQQLVGMDQIASAIANIRQATLQNTAGTRQLEASARGLQELGGRLKSLVERQRVEG